MPDQPDFESDAVDALKRSIPAIDAVVTIPVADLHRADAHINNAMDRLADFIGKKMDEQGFEDQDEALASPDLCALLEVHGMIEDAGFNLEATVSKSLALVEGLGTEAKPSSGE